MNRILILAAVAAFAAGSASAQAIRVSTQGKTTDQVKAEVYQAALKVCRTEVTGYAYRIDEARACVAHTVRDTLVQSQDPTLRLAAR